MTGSVHELLWSFFCTVAATRPFIGHPTLILSSGNYAWVGNKFLNGKVMVLE
jgi:hypothetical protein